VRKADNLPPSRAVVMKSGNLNVLEPSGPVQACNGTALPFYIKFENVAEFQRQWKCGFQTQPRTRLAITRLCDQYDTLSGTVPFVMCTGDVTSMIHCLVLYRL